MADDLETDSSGGDGPAEADLIEEKEEGEVVAELRELANQNQALEFLTRHHPEIRLDYKEEVLTRLPLQSYPPDSGVDAKHKSVPYLTPFEKTKVIGFRANQLAKGAQLLITLGANQKHITDVLELARMELEQQRLPFIIKRPMPDGSFEYWRLKDLLIL
jgi:DNA-directed RNA polymerase I, II, and III subunit RPABC2